MSEGKIFLDTNILVPYPSMTAIINKIFSHRDTEKKERAQRKIGFYKS